MTCISCRGQECTPVAVVRQATGVPQLHLPCQPAWVLDDDSETGLLGYDFELLQAVGQLPLRLGSEHARDAFRHMGRHCAQAPDRAGEQLAIDDAAEVAITGDWFGCLG
ncbi:hypothetical protein [Streptomyces sp. NPDC048385]|uniref:hypothetical protein n=1 Tax=unclassified Streptomyces TaxID=2593676 RepID=UPI003435EF82